MKIIFLDIDGVVNCISTKVRAPSKVVGVEQRLISRIKQIVEATGAKLVLSSTWRQDWFYEHMGGNDWPYLRDEFAKQNLYFIDHTPLHKDRNRGREIQDWLENTSYDVTSYVIIDDEMYDIRDLHKGHMVKTSYGYGIEPKAVDLAIEILRKEHNSYA